MAHLTSKRLASLLDGKLNGLSFSSSTEPVTTICSFAEHVSISAFSSAEPLSAPSSSLESESATSSVDHAPAFSPAETMSASKRKISLFEPISVPAGEGTTFIMDFSIIEVLYSKALCPQCMNPGLQLCHDKAKDRLWAVHLQLISSVQ
ncbi:hypothetical protein PoB_002951500 [Plakobranchus ocellatus]|uniref:Uncharacterized protein n=1 Tax=Plakobranchus ocellatus TaxID=259542 RepID=A0AAV4A4F7_9GAST|nr:hypothetical protein PoB_002951500 [Plakobranchus ocellatus]